MAQPSDNVWVGGLPADIDQSKMEAIFSPYGVVVSCKLLPPKAPGQTPCGFVKFGSVEVATWVVENLSGNVAEGLKEPITCRFANAPGGGKGDQRGGPYSSGKGGKAGSWPQWDGGNGNARSWTQWDGGKSSGLTFDAVHQAVKGSGILGGGQPPVENQVYIAGLPSDTTDLGLYQLMASFGGLMPNGVKAMMHADGTCRGFGFVDYMEAENAKNAVATLNGFVLPDGSTFKVNTKQDSGSKGASKGKAKATDGKVPAPQE